MSGVIYTITTGDDGYVGSTRDFNHRYKCHRAVINNPNCKGYNLKLYKKIRENDGEYEISIYKENLSMSDEELCIYEDELVLLLGATLNDRKAHRSDDDYKQWGKNYRNNNKERITKTGKEYRIKHKDKIREQKLKKIKCECGCVVTYTSIARHRKSAKHLRLMATHEQA